MVNQKRALKVASAICLAILFASLAFSVFTPLRSVAEDSPNQFNPPDLLPPTGNDTLGIDTLNGGGDAANPVEPTLIDQMIDIVASIL